MAFYRIFLIGTVLFIGTFTLNAQIELPPIFGPKSGGKPTTEVDKMKELEPDIISEVRIGKVVSSLKIEALDGSFTLTQDKQFRPTEYTVGYVNPGPGFTKMFKKSKGKKVKIDYTYDVDETKIVEGDTITVQVKKDGFIYGILEFNYVYDQCADLPVTRNYNIEIPYETIINAMDGKISAAYEYYTCTHEVPKYNGKGVKKEGKTQKVTNSYTTWVLFLSDIPF